MKKAFLWLRTYFALIVVLATFGWSAFMVTTYRNKQTPPGATIIRIGHWQLEASVRDAIEAMAKEYRKLHPDVYVVQDAIPDSVYGQWVSTQLMGGTAPDIVQVGSMLAANVWLSYYNRYFVPLTRDVSRPNPYNAGTDIADAPLRQTYKDGMRASYVYEMQEYMSVPLAQFGIRVFYNKDLLKKLTGLDVAPTNYQAFIQACRTIASKTDPRGKPYSAIASSAYHFSMWEPMMFDPITYGTMKKADLNRDGSVGNDELYVAVKTGMVDFHYPSIAAKFKLLREVADYFQTGYTGLTRDEAVFLFAQQKAVFMSTGTWDARSLQKVAEGQFEVGVMDFPFPTPDDPEFGSVVDGPRYDSTATGFQFGLTRTSRHPEIALDFMLFMASRPHNEELNRIIGWIPAINGTKTDPLLQAFEPHLEGIYGAFNVWLGGETATKWMQLYAQYQINQISYEQLVEQFEPFYKEQGLKDFMEQQRDWRRGMQENERFLAGFRAQALAASGDEATSSWIKYRAITASRQVWNELNHSKELKLLDEKASPGAVGPYEYSERVIDHVRERIRAENL